MTKIAPVRDFLTDHALTSPLEDLVVGDPEDVIATVGKLYGMGVTAEIRAYYLIARTIDQLAKDEDAHKAFLKGLSDQKIISASEAEMSRKSPKLSNIRQIARLAPVLLRDDIRPYVPTGYQAQYELVKLFDEMNGDTADEKLAGLLAFCASAGEKMTIKVIAAEREAQKIRAQAAQVPQVPVLSEASEQAGNDSEQAQTPFDLLLLTPNSDHFRNLGKEYAEAPPCLAIETDRLATSATAVIVGPLRLIYRTHRKVLHDLGFGELEAFYIHKGPHSTNISDAVVAAVATKGRPATLPLKRWEERVEPIFLADAIAPDSKSKIHVFAERDSEGWNALVGDKNWSVQ